MKLRTLSLGFASLALSLVSLVASAQSYSNASQIIINDGTSATPYPSTIAVSSFSAPVTDVKVALHGVSHTWLADINVLLVSPAGQKIVLMGRVLTSGDFQNAEVVFSAGAAATIPTNLSVVPSGTYLPTVGSATDSYAPAPPGPYTTDLTVLNGSASNAVGTWSLYVSDHAGADVGQIAQGWTLAFNGSSTDLVTTTCASEGYTGTKLEWCKNICERGYTGGTLDMWIRRWVDRYRQLPYCAVK